MKKFFLALGLAACLTAANAQNFIRQNMLNNLNITLTNAATFVTNLNDALGGTNQITVLMTNLGSSSFFQTNSLYTTNSTVPVQNVNAFKDVPFIIPGPGANNYITTGAATNCTLEVGFGYAGASATNGFGIVLVPLLSGPEPGSCSTCPLVEDTQNTLTFTNTAGVTTSNAVYHFAINSAPYAGYWGLRVKYVYLPGVIGGVAAGNSQIVLTNISLNGWRP